MINKLDIMNSEERKKIIAKSPISFKYLKRFNSAAGLLHLIQGIIMLILGLQLEWSRNIYTVYTKIPIIDPAIFKMPESEK